MATTNEAIRNLKPDFAHTTSIEEVRSLARTIGVTPLYLFLSLVDSDRVSDAVSYAEVTGFETIFTLAKKIRAGTFIRNGRTYHLPKEVEEKKISDMAQFMKLVWLDNFSEAVRIGLASKDTKVKNVATMLRDGDFKHPRNEKYVAPQLGHGSVRYFWEHYAVHGHQATYRWIQTVKALRELMYCWDAGKLYDKKTGEYLKPVIKPKQPVKSGGVPAARRAKLLRRSLSDQEDRLRMKGN